MGKYYSCEQAEDEGGFNYSIDLLRESKQRVSVAGAVWVFALSSDTSRKTSVLFMRYVAFLVQ